MDTRQQKNEKVSSDEWYTPRWIIEELGPFDLDPCSPSDRPFDTATVHITKEQDGLQYDWGSSRVWLNPPYSKDLLRAFVEKMASHNNGIALLVNRTDNLLFQEVIFPKAVSMLFMRNRVRFTRPDGSTGNPFFGSVLVAFGSANDEILKNCSIEGKYVVLNQESSRMTREVFMLEKKKLQQRENDAYSLLNKQREEIKAALNALRQRYLSENKPIPVGSDVRVTIHHRNKGDEVRTGVVTGYSLYSVFRGEEDIIHYNIIFPPRTERCVPVNDEKWFVEKIV